MGRGIKLKLLIGAMALIGAATSEGQDKTLNVAGYGGSWEQTLRKDVIPGLREEARREGRVRRRQLDRHAGQAAGAEGATR